MDSTRFRFLIERNNDLHIHTDIELFFVMEGAGDFIIGDKRYHLKKEDFIVVNPNQQHGFRTLDKNFLAASIIFSYSNLAKMLKKDIFFLVCNSAVNDNESIHEMRNILKKIVIEQHYNKDENVIYLNSLYYELLNILCTDFMLKDDEKGFQQDEHKFDERKYKITEYVKNNYDKDISLKDLADKLYLSNAYLSKYIKKQFGMNFIEYVNSIRLSYAVTQILYSDKPLVRIAMDTGFASSAALNKVFKEKYNMSPAEYRISWKKKENKSENSEAEQEKIKKQVSGYFDRNQNKNGKNTDLYSEYVRVDDIVYKPLDKVWSQMINMGTVSDLLHSDVQQHLLYLKEKLHFKYVRFWDLYSTDTYMNIRDNSSDYNFDKLFRVLDFLVKNDLIPYIELRRKPKKLVQNSQIRLKMPVETEDPDLNSTEKFMRKLITSLINRYTTVEVEKWYFEVWKLEREKYQNEVVIEDKAESIPLYLDVFDTIAGTLRQYLPDIKIGGGGLAIRWGEKHFVDILESWKQRKNLPDFLTIYAYPYTADSIAMSKSQSLDVDFMKKTFMKIHTLLEEAEFPDIPLHISEWSFSASSRNILNDHVMKGAYMVKCMIDSISLVDLMGYWVGSDLFSDYYDTRCILNGGGGLISKDGIPKPAFYAMFFMNRLGKYFIRSGNNYILTDNGKGNYRIVCHNLKNLSYQYGLMKEDQHLPTTVGSMFTDLKKNKIVFDLPATRGAKYTLRISFINQKSGSILDEWIELSCDEDLNPSDLNYLSRVTTPKVVHASCEEHNGKIHFETILEPNEIQFIHVTHKFIE